MVGGGWPGSEFERNVAAALATAKRCVPDAVVEEEQVAGLGLQRRARNFWPVDAKRLRVGIDFLLGQVLVVGHFMRTGNDA